MNLFTVNQVNQVYVAKGTFVSGNNSYTPTKGSGNVYGGITPDGKSIYFKHAGMGGVVRTDLIDLDKIMYYKTTVASDMAKSLKEYRLKLSADAMDAVDNTKVIKGQDYILRIKLDHYIGISPEDSEYWKYGMVHSGPSTTVAAFWKEMAKSILRNMSREAVKFIELYPITTASSTDSVGSTELNLANVETQMASATGLAIREVEPDWILGLKQQKIMHIEVTPVAFEYDGATIYWANGQSYDTKLEPVDSGETIPNGKLTADYEYFFHGERADQYRKVGWPDYIPTEYMVDPTKEYDYVQIHYSYIGSNESCQKSEKDLTFLVPRVGNETNDSTKSTVAASIETFIKNSIDSLGASAANAAITSALGEGGAIATAIAGS